MSAAGYGFFAYSEPVSVPNAIELGDDLDTPLTTGQRKKLERAIGRENDWTISLKASTPRGILAEFLTTASDPTGAKFAKPLLSEEIHLGGHSVVWRGRIADSPGWKAKVVAVYKTDFEHLRGHTPDVDHLRRVLGSFDLRLAHCGIRASDICSDLEPLAPTTTITESFNTADSSTIGPDLSWTEIDGDWEIDTNELQDPAGGTINLLRADSDLSSADHYAQLIVASLGAGASRIGAAARVQTDDGTTITAYYVNLRNNDDLELEKIIDDSDTELSVDAQTVSLPDLVRVQCDGSTITSWFNDVKVGDVTDTGITGYLRCGCSARNSSGNQTARGDDFEAADLASGFTGTSVATLPALTTAASGTQTHSATSVANLPGITTAASGTQTHSGTSVAALPGLAAAATGTQTHSATSVATLPSLAASAAGTQTQTGTAVATLPSLTAAATGTHPYVGTSVVSLPALTASSAGTQTHSATAVATLPSLGAAASGTTGITGTSVATLPALTAAATGTHPYVGTAVDALPSLTAAASGTQTHSGTSVATLPTLTAAASGTVGGATTGTAVATLPSLGAAATSTQTFSGTSTATLPSLTATATATQTFSSTAAATLPSLGASAAGTQEITGTTAVTLPSLTASAAGTQTHSGTSVATLPSLGATAAGVTDITGTAAATLPSLTASVVGTVTADPDAQEPSVTTGAASMRLGIRKGRILVPELTPAIATFWAAVRIRLVPAKVETPARVPVKWEMSARVEGELLMPAPVMSLRRSVGAVVFGSTAVMAEANYRRQVRARVVARLEVEVAVTLRAGGARMQREAEEAALLGLG